jgi:hypothetical protein
LVTSPRLTYVSTMIWKLAGVLTYSLITLLIVLRRVRSSWPPSPPTILLAVILASSYLLAASATFLVTLSNSSALAKFTNHIRV